MSKLVLPLVVERRPLWIAGFVAGLVRGLLTVGASGALTVLALLWMRANGYLIG